MLKPSGKEKPKKISQPSLIFSTIPEEKKTDEEVVPRALQEGFDDDTTSLEVSVKTEDDFPTEIEKETEPIINEIKITIEEPIEKTVKEQKTPGLYNQKSSSSEKKAHR